MLFICFARSKRNGLLNPLSANRAKWSASCLSMFDRFVGLGLKELICSGLDK